MHKTRLDPRYSRYLFVRLIMEDSWVSKLEARNEPKAKA